MKPRSFIRTSSHETFFHHLNVVLNNNANNKEDENIRELARNKEEIEKIIIRYRRVFAELNILFIQYQSQQLAIRKKIRKLQIKPIAKNRIPK